MDKFNTEKPIYKQIIEIIQIKIIKNEYKLGSKILSVRDLALEYKVNPNTISRALQVLEEDKFISTDRTNGKYVTNDSKIVLEAKNKFAEENGCMYFKGMNKLGFKKEEAINYLKENGKECD